MLIKWPLDVMLMTFGIFVYHSLKPRYDSHSTPRYSFSPKTAENLKAKI